MSLAGVRARVRRQHGLNAALTAYAEWLWPMVAPKAHPRYRLNVYLTRREGKTRDDGFLRYVQAGTTRTRLSVNRRFARMERLPDVVPISIHVFVQGVLRGLESFTGTLVHEMVHARQVIAYIEARHWAEHSDRDEAWEAEADAYRVYSTAADAEEQANRLQFKVMRTLTASEMRERAAPFWSALAAAHALW